MKHTRSYSIWQEKVAKAEVYLDRLISHIDVLPFASMKKKKSKKPAKMFETVDCQHKSALCNN